MTDLSEGIVELYAEHLLKKAASAVVTLAVGGAIGGAALGAVPGLLSHSLISPDVNYFAVLLGAIAGGFLGRSIGDKRAVGLRLQAQMALHQLQVENRLVAPPAAPAARPAAPAPAPAAPAPVPVAPPALPAIPRLVEPPALPPLSQPAPPLSADSAG